jgi:hypothetical protein
MVLQDRLFNTFHITMRKRALPRDTDDEKKRRATTTPSTPSYSNQVLNYSETANSPFQPALGLAIPQNNIPNETGHCAGVVDSESRVYGVTAVFPLSSQHEISTTKREDLREDTRIQPMNYRIPSRQCSERHPSTGGSILPERRDGDVVLHANIDKTIETARGIHSLSVPPASKIQDSIISECDQNQIDLNLSFPVKLHMILSDPRYQSYIEWAPHGRAWKVHNPGGLESVVIPKFFRSEKYSSFMRQVSFSALFECWCIFISVLLG